MKFRKWAERAERHKRRKRLIDADYATAELELAYRATMLESRLDIISHFREVKGTLHR